jgi:hypothetical protein
MAGQLAFGIASIVVFVLWQFVKPGKSIFDK